MTAFKSHQNNYFFLDFLAGVLTVSFKALPALNLGALEAGILLAAPVCGFLPVLAALSATSNVPKPTNWIFSPAFNCSATVSVKALRAFSASFLESSAFSAIEQLILTYS